MSQEVIVLDKSHLRLLFRSESILGREGQSSIENVMAWVSQSSCSCSKHRWPKIRSSFQREDMEELKNKERIYLHHARNIQHGPQSWLCTSFSFLLLFLYFLFFFLPPSFSSLLFFISSPFPSPFFPYPISFSPPPFSTESIDLLKLEQKHYIHSIGWEQAPEITWLEI